MNGHSYARMRRTSHRRTTVSVLCAYTDGGLRERTHNAAGRRRWSSCSRTALAWGSPTSRTLPRSRRLSLAPHSWRRESPSNSSASLGCELERERERERAPPFGLAVYTHCCPTVAQAVCELGAVSCTHLEDGSALPAKLCNCLVGGPVERVARTGTLNGCCCVLE
jgi:hypothetical protein